MLADTTHVATSGSRREWSPTLCQQVGPAHHRHPVSDSTVSTGSVGSGAPSFVRTGRATGASSAASQASPLPLPHEAAPVIQPMMPPGAHHVTSAAGGRAIVIPALVGGKATSPARGGVGARQDAWIALKIAEGYSVINDSVSYYPSLDRRPRPKEGGRQPPTNPWGQHWDTTDSPPAVSLRAPRVLTAFQPSPVQLAGSMSAPSAMPRRLGVPQDENGGSTLPSLRHLPSVSPSIQPKPAGLSAAVQPPASSQAANAQALLSWLPEEAHVPNHVTNQLPQKLRISPLNSAVKNFTATAWLIFHSTQPPVERPAKPVVGMGRHWKETAALEPVLAGGLRRPRPKVTAASEPVLAGSKSTPARTRRLGSPVKLNTPQLPHLDRALVDPSHAHAWGGCAPTDVDQDARGRLPLPFTRRLSTGVRDVVEI